MPFKPGQSGNPDGRAKGSSNKATALVKDLVSQALEAKGGVEYLIQQADANPTAFLTLVGKLIPVQVGGDPNGSPMRVEEIRRIIVK